YLMKLFIVFSTLFQEMKEQVLCKHQLFTVGETPFFGVKDAIRMTNEIDGFLNMVFQFELMDVDSAPGKGKWIVIRPDIMKIKKIMHGWQLSLAGKGWNSLYLENHDQPRSVSRFGDDKHLRLESAKMLATWLLSMQGTPYVYQGQEIGLTNAYFDNI